jgi:hypothetical protein
LRASLGTNSSHRDHRLCPDLQSIDESTKVNWLDRQCRPQLRCYLLTKIRTYVIAGDKYGELQIHLS